MYEVKEKTAEEIVLIRYYNVLFYYFLRQGWMILRDNA